MAVTIKIAPMNRIEGHHDIETVLTAAGAGWHPTDRVVSVPKSICTMFRGFENILIGRDPRDATIFCQRICGVCPITHGAAASKNLGTAFGFKVHHEDPGQDTWYKDSTGQHSSTDLGPVNGRLVRNLGCAANYMMSHILHFYHLAALDFVDATGLIGKGHVCPNYDNSYFNPPGPIGIPLNVLIPYLAGQYVRALKFRRLCQQLGGLWLGKMPCASAYTPGWVTTGIPSDIHNTSSPIRQKFEELMWAGPGHVPQGNVNSPGSNNLYPANGPLAWQGIAGAPITPNTPHPESLLGFIGLPADFLWWLTDAGGVSVPNDPASLPPWSTLTGPQGWKYAGTYLFDLVAVAHYYPEYFWIGTGYGRLLAYGAFEGSATDSGIPTSAHPDDRLFVRGRVHLGPVAGQIQHRPMDHLKIGELLDSSYFKEPAGTGNVRHPWDGKTKPKPDKPGAYTYAKTPRYDNQNADFGHPTGYVPYEVGPLARMMANCVGLTNPPPGALTTGEVNAILTGDRMAYYPGILNDLGYVLTPAWGSMPPASIAGFPKFGGAYTGDGTIDRHAARGIETLYVAKNSTKWFKLLLPGVKSNQTQYFNWGGSTQRKKPKKAKGVGLTEAPRGALAHWIRIGENGLGGKTTRYQVITPTAWNISPVDVNGRYGPEEYCVLDTPIADKDQPVEILRVLHSFDNCLACTVHVIAHDEGKKVKVKVPTRTA